VCERERVEICAGYVAHGRHTNCVHMFLLLPVCASVFGWVGVGEKVRGSVSCVAHVHPISCVARKSMSHVAHVSCMTLVSGSHVAHVTRWMSRVAHIREFVYVHLNHTCKH